MQFLSQVYPFQQLAYSCFRRVCSLLSKVTTYRSKQLLNLCGLQQTFLFFRVLIHAAGIPIFCTLRPRLRGHLSGEMLQVFPRERDRGQHSKHQAVLEVSLPVQITSTYNHRTNLKLTEWKGSSFQIKGIKGKRLQLFSK